MENHSITMKLLLCAAVHKGVESVSQTNTKQKRHKAKVRGRKSGNVGRKRMFQAFYRFTYICLPHMQPTVTDVVIRGTKVTVTTNKTSRNPKVWIPEGRSDELWFAWSEVLKLEIEDVNQLRALHTHQIIVQVWNKQETIIMDKEKLKTPRQAIGKKRGGSRHHIASFLSVENFRDSMQPTRLDNRRRKSKVGLAHSARQRTAASHNSQADIVAIEQQSLSAGSSQLSDSHSSASSASPIRQQNRFLNTPFGQLKKHQDLEFLIDEQTLAALEVNANHGYRYVQSTLNEKKLLTVVSGRQAVGCLICDIMPLMSNQKRTYGCVLYVTAPLTTISLIVSVDTEVITPSMATILKPLIISVKRLENLPNFTRCHTDYHEIRQRFQPVYVRVKMPPPLPDHVTPAQEHSRTITYNNDSVVFLGGVDWHGLSPHLQGRAKLPLEIHDTEPRSGCTGASSHGLALLPLMGADMGIGVSHRLPVLPRCDDGRRYESLYLDWRTEIVVYVGTVGRQWWYHHEVNLVDHVNQQRFLPFMVTCQSQELRETIQNLLTNPNQKPAEEGAEDNDIENHSGQCAHKATSAHILHSRNLENMGLGLPDTAESIRICDMTYTNASIRDDDELSNNRGNRVESGEKENMDISVEDTLTEPSESSVGMQENIDARGNNSDLDIEVTGFSVCIPGDFFMLVLEGEYRFITGTILPCLHRLPIKTHYDLSIFSFNRLYPETSPLQCHMSLPSSPYHLASHPSTWYISKGYTCESHIAITKLALMLRIKTIAILDRENVFPTQTEVLSLQMDLERIRNKQNKLNKSNRKTNDEESVSKSADKEQVCLVEHPSDRLTGGGKKGGHLDLPRMTFWMKKDPTSQLDKLLGILKDKPMKLSLKYTPEYLIK